MCDRQTNDPLAIRFDIEGNTRMLRIVLGVGLALGRVVGRHAVERERRGGLNAWRTARVERKP